jgi:predicted HNH restriction endonuclease
MNSSSPSRDGVFIASSLTGEAVFIEREPRLKSEPVSESVAITWSDWPFSWSSWPHNEIRQVIKTASTDPESARRLAELLELVQDYRAAKLAWKQAAELGDRDAIDYYAVLTASPEAQRRFEEGGTIPDDTDA